MYSPAPVSHQPKVCPIVHQLSWTFKLNMQDYLADEDPWVVPAWNHLHFHRTSGLTQVRLKRSEVAQQIKMTNSISKKENWEVYFDASF